MDLLKIRPENMSNLRWKAFPRRQKALKCPMIYAFLSPTLRETRPILFSLSILLITLSIGWELLHNSQLPIHKFGWKFLWVQVWDPVAENFGAIPFIYGTLVSSLIALVVAGPLGLGVAIFLSEVAPA